MKNIYSQRMLPFEVVLLAAKIMKEDARLLSIKEGSFFWDNDFSGLTGLEKQRFNEFQSVERIELSLVHPKRADDDGITKIINDHVNMTGELRKALLLNPDKNAHKMLFLASQFTFILIMNRAIGYYSDALSHEANK